MEGEGGELGFHEHVVRAQERIQVARGHVNVNRFFSGRKEHVHAVAAILPEFSHKMMRNFLLFGIRKGERGFNHSVRGFRVEFGDAFPHKIIEWRLAGGGSEEFHVQLTVNRRGFHESFTDSGFKTV